MNDEIISAIIRVSPFIVILLIFFIFIKVGKITTHELYLNKPQTFFRFIGWTFAFLIFVLLAEFILYKAGLLEVTPWNHGTTASVIRIFGVVILAPIAEELLFRGLILTKLTTRNLNIHVAIFAQAVLFVLLHNFTWQNTLTSNIGIVQTLVDATLFAYARYSTKSIYTPVAMHMTGNLVATLERFIL